LLLLSLILGFASPGLAGKGKGKARTTVSAGIPATALNVIPDSARFADTEYARLLAGDALRTTVPQEALFERMSAALGAGENYKALFLARILTERSPDDGALWNNRSRLAGSLGLDSEATACAANAEVSGIAGEISASLLPEAFEVSRPTSLADWANALALMGQDLQATAAGITAIKDTVRRHAD